MTEPNDLMTQMNKFQFKETAVLDKLRNLCRAILPMLKDHKLDNVANDLGALLFELDAIDQERTEALLKDPQALIAFFLKGLGQPPR